VELFGPRGAQEGKVARIHVQELRDTVMTCSVILNIAVVRRIDFLEISTIYGATENDTDEIKFLMRRIQ
jgi:hypothetical protein